MGNEVAAVVRTSEQSRLLSNEGRVLILRCLGADGRSSWSRLKSYLDKSIGPVNPNTLHFHLKTLEKAGWVKRGGSTRDPAYTLGDIPPQVAAMIWEPAQIPASLRPKQN